MIGRKRTRTGARRNVVSFDSRAGLRQAQVTAAANRAVRATTPVRPVAPDAGGLPVAAEAAPRVAALRFASTPGAPANLTPGATVASLLGAASGDDWPAFVAERIATWADGYFGTGAAGQRSPWCGDAPYAAWRGEAELDRTPEILGVPAYCAIARTLPRDADALLLRAAHELRLDSAQFATYLEQLLPAIDGWAAAARRHARNTAHAFAGDAGVKDVLAIRAAWDVILRDAFERRQPGLAAALRDALANAASDRNATGAIDGDRRRAQARFG